MYSPSSNIFAPSGIEVILSFLNGFGPPIANFKCGGVIQIFILEKKLTERNFYTEYMVQ